jgi:ABC-type multidrug transport system ATPase subunit
MVEPGVVFEGVSRDFGSVTAVEDVTLSIDRGSLVAIVGPNGSGKSTLLQLVTGLIAPKSGTIRIPQEPERPVGFVPQQLGFRPTLTVEETVRFYGSLLDPPPTPESVLKTTGLEAVQDRKIDALSGGMRRLLGVATAFFGDPPVLALDEPTAGLDPRNAAHIFDVVTDRTDDETAVLLATHDLARLDVADSIIVLARGRVVVKASPTELLDRTNSVDLAQAFESILGSDPEVQSGRSSKGFS